MDTVFSATTPSREKDCHPNRIIITDNQQLDTSTDPLVSGGQIAVEVHTLNLVVLGLLAPAK